MIGLGRIIVKERYFPSGVGIESATAFPPGRWPVFFTKGAKSGGRFKLSENSHYVWTLFKG
jgi:hypothetical protein